MSKKILWSDLRSLRNLVATQNAVLLNSVAGLAKSHEEHFKSNATDRSYLLGVLDVLKRNTADISVVSNNIEEIVTKLLIGKNGPDTKVIVNSIIKFPKKNNVRTKDQVKYLGAMTDLQKYGEIVAITGSDLIMELTTRLNLATDKELIEDVVKTTEAYLGETDGTSK